MHTYYIYMLECRDGSYYTGVTNDVERRLWEHETGALSTAYTHERRSVKLVYTEDFNNIWDAIGREKQIKRWSRARKQALINGKWNMLSQIAHRRCQCEKCIRTFRPCTKDHLGADEGPECHPSSAVRQAHCGPQGDNFGACPERTCGEHIDCAQCKLRRTSRGSVSGRQSFQVPQVHIIVRSHAPVVFQTNSAVIQPSVPKL